MDTQTAKTGGFRRGTCKTAQKGTGKIVETAELLNSAKIGVDFLRKLR